MKQRARDLRNSSTLAEVLLWNRLKGRKVMGLMFSRQRPVGEFIVDFICDELKLIIEIDGASHRDKGVYDESRQRKLEDAGFSFFRVTDLKVKHDAGSVVAAIEAMARDMMGVGRS